MSPLRRTSWPLALAALTACAPVEYDPVLGYAGDRDGDGWLDYEEARAGSDPQNRFDWDFGSGRWPDFTDEALADGVFATGWDAGDTVADFLSVDQYGNPVPFYTFYGYVVILEFVAGDCAPCRDKADGSQRMWVDHRLDGVLIVHQVVDDDDPAPGIRPKFPEDWSLEHRLDHPVMRDDDSRAYVAFNELRPPELRWTIPFTVVLDDRFRVVQTFDYDAPGELAHALAVELSSERDSQ